jgi:hypothetical protein
MDVILTLTAMTSSTGASMSDTLKDAAPVPALTALGASAVSLPLPPEHAAKPPMSIPSAAVRAVRSFVIRTPFIPLGTEHERLLARFHRVSAT